MTDRVWPHGRYVAAPPALNDQQGAPFLFDVNGRLVTTSGGGPPGPVIITPHGVATAGTWNYNTGDFGVVQSLGQLLDRESLLPTNVPASGDRAGNILTRRGLADPTASPTATPAGQSLTGARGVITDRPAYLYQIIPCHQFPQNLYFGLRNGNVAPVEGDAITLPILVAPGTTLTVNMDPEVIFLTGICFGWSLAPDTFAFPVIERGLFMGANFVTFKN